MEEKAIELLDQLESLDGGYVEIHPAMLDMIAQAFAREREAALEEAAALVIKYAVNLGGHGPVKPLFEDHRGKDDVVRNAYAVAIRALKARGVNQTVG